jgi:hypothetical protein
MSGLLRRSGTDAARPTGLLPRLGYDAYGVLSDDGSKLYIDKKEIIDNDGIRPAKAVFGDVKLKAGVHDIRVSFSRARATS